MRTKETVNALFRAICLLFSALLLILSLLSGIDLTAANDEAARLKAELRAYEEENRILQARIDEAGSLAELERRAREELMMQPAGPGQIVVPEPVD
jgi:cell division protein FtsL